MKEGRRKKFDKELKNCNRMMDMEKRDYEELVKENQLLKDMVDTAIEEFLRFDRDHGIVLVNNMVFCETYETVYQCLRDRALKKQEEK